MSTSASRDTAESASARRRPTGDRLVLAALIITTTGLLAVIAGTFLPWLTSGGVDRNSYAIAGVLTRLGFAGTGFGATALSGWPLLGPIAMLAVITGILRWWRTGALIALLYGILTGVIGAGVVAVAGGHRAAGVALAYTGPVVTMLGALAAVVGSVIVLTRAGSRGSGRAGRGDGSKDWSGDNRVSTEPGGGSYRPSNQEKQ